MFRFSLEIIPPAPHGLGSSFPIPPGRALRVGRSLSETDICLPSTFLSRRHCEVRLEGYSLAVTDLESTSGTRINDNRITRGRTPDLLRVGDVLGIGRIKLRLRADVEVNPLWLHRNDRAVQKLARHILDQGDVSCLPVLADALEEVGCTDTDLLNLCRRPSSRPADRPMIDLVLELLSPDMKAPVPCLLCGFVKSPESGPRDTSRPACPVCDEGYRLGEFIGRGRGEVWHALSPEGAPVAFKALPLEIDAEGNEYDRDRPEARAGGPYDRLRHPHLLRVHSERRLGDRRLLVLERAAGYLEDRLPGGPGGSPAEELIGPFREAAGALDYLHGQGVLHRNLKPRNLFCGDDGHVRLEAPACVVRSAAGGEQFCDPIYTAPEAWRGTWVPASDQFSLAASYARLRLGRLPFQGHVLMVRAPYLHPLPSTEQRVLSKALAREPWQRYPDCLAFVTDLEKAHLRGTGPSGVLGRISALWRK